MLSPMEELLRYVPKIDTPWKLSALAICAVIGAFNTFVLKPKPAVRRALWVVVGGILTVVIVQLITASVTFPIYRVRVTAVDKRNNVPIEGATVRTTAANESKTAPDGSCELAIPKGSLSANGRVTIFADKNTAFLHGQSELQLGSDSNPSLILYLEKDRTAGLHGVVRDEDGNVVSAASVTVAGITATTTDTFGNFDIAPQFAQGEDILVHVEKPGHKAFEQWVRAGDDTIVINLRLKSRTSR